MISGLKKIVFPLVLSIIFAQTVVALQPWTPYRPAEEILQDTDSLKKLSQWIQVDKKTYHKTKHGIKDLSSDLFHVIINSQEWNNIQTKSSNNNKNARTLLALLKSSGFSNKSLYIIKNPLVNNNLYLILRHMHRLGFSAADIKNFNHFILTLFASSVYKDILNLKKALITSDSSAVYQLLMQGIHPNWIVDQNLNTAIFIAMRKHDADIVQLILACPGYNIFAFNNENNSALMQSLWKQNKSITYLLLNYTPTWDYSSKNIYGETTAEILEKRLPNNHLIKNRLNHAIDAACYYALQEEFTN